MNTLAKQLGQSMTEYTVVLFFGVMTLTSGYMGDAVQALTDVMKKNYEGYSFAISLSEAPDYDSDALYRTALSNPVLNLSAEEINRLAVNSSKLYKDLKPYNKDPLRQIKKGISTLKNCISQIPTSVNQIINKPVNCP